MEIASYIILTDQQLVTLAMDGDSAAFEVLFGRYRDSIYKLYLGRTSGNVDDANDLLQETFIKVLLNLDKYNTAYTFGQWVYTIAKNTFVDYVRKRRDDVSIDKLPSSGNSIVPMATEATPEERIINNQQYAQIAGHLEKMKPRYRRLIELRFFKEYSYEEIAEEMKLPMGTVKTQIHRAREQLCKLIIDSDML